MSFVVFGILQAGNNNALLVVFLALGAGFMLWFFLHIRANERAGKEPLLSTGLLRNRTSNLGLVTQNIQWLLLMGITFVVSVFLQTVRDFSAIKTGVVFTAATAGILVSSLAAERLARSYAQRTLIRTGFLVTIAGVGLLLALVKASSHVLAFTPGLLLVGLGLGGHADPVGRRRSVQLPRGEAWRDLRAFAASPTWGRPWARRSPGRSSSPT